MNNEKFLKKWEAERVQGVKMYAMLMSVQVIFAAHVVIMLYNLANKNPLFTHLHWSLPYLGGVVFFAVVGWGLGHVFWKINEKKYLEQKKIDGATDREA